jgi:hypothetical protein
LCSYKNDQLKRNFKHIYLSLFILSVFSLTLQSSILNFCKENKLIKTQSQQNQSAEEEEESKDSDDFADEEIICNASIEHAQPSILLLKTILSSLDFLYPVNYKKIPIPPPKVIC